MAPPKKLPPATPARLDAESRALALKRMASETFDVFIVGGGVVGCGAALDAASRGLSVGLAESQDFSSGTSSRSSKLIHGGLRYLEQRDFRLVREALRERSLLLQQIAPHLVRPVPFLYPLTKKYWERFYVGAGMVLYDQMGGRVRGVPRHRHFSRRGTHKLVPGMAPDSMVGGIQYYDAQVDDARFTVNLVRTAVDLGAAAVNNTRVIAFHREGERVTGVRIRDLLTGIEIDVKARQVLNATGVWADDLQGLMGERGKFKVRISKGIHVVIPRDRIQLETGVILRAGASVLFIIPWGRHWLLGTTDTDWNLDKTHPAASKKDIDYILNRVNEVVSQPLDHEDVEGVWAGLRPLLSAESDSTSQLSREHIVVTPVPGMVAVAGGKFTTYRVMAKDAVDAAARGIDRAVAPSCTHVTPLMGAAGFQAAWNSRSRLAAASGLPLVRVEHLLARYGTLVHEVLQVIAEHPELARPMADAPDYLGAEIHYAASHEGALHLEDVLMRRTRISIETWDRGYSAAEPAAEIVGNVLGWSKEERKRQLAVYRELVEAERNSQQQPDDQTADSALQSVPRIAATKASESGD